MHILHFDEVPSWLEIIYFGNIDLCISLKLVKYDPLVCYEYIGANLQLFSPCSRLGKQFFLWQMPIFFMVKCSCGDLD